MASVVQELHEKMPIDGKMPAEGTNTYFVKIPQDLKDIKIILYTLSDDARLKTYVLKNQEKANVKSE